MATPSLFGSGVNTLGGGTGGPPQLFGNLDTVKPQAEPAKSGSLFGGGIGLTKTDSS